MSAASRLQESRGAGLATRAFAIASSEYSERISRRIHKKYSLESIDNSVHRSIHERHTWRIHKSRIWNPLEYSHQAQEYSQEHLPSQVSVDFIAVMRIGFGFNLGGLLHSSKNMLVD